jgi:hypothetical protein
MRQMVAIPSVQSSIGCVFKQKIQRRRLNVAVAKDNVGFGQMADFGWGRITKPCVRVVPPEQVLAGKKISVPLP